MFSKMWLLAASLALSGLAHAFSPETGTWVFHDEENGKPGRGLTLDVQNGTLVATLYGYEQSGQPTFYTGVGKLEYRDPITAPSSALGDDVKATIELVRYTGGRYIGSEARDAVAAGSIGKAEFLFIDGTLGYVTLPGESIKRISRYAFGAPKKSAEQMLGAWIFSTEKYSDDVRTSQEAEVFVFNSIAEEVDSSGEKLRYAVSHDGRMKCREAFPGFVFLGTGREVRLFTSPKTCFLSDTQGKILKRYDFKIGINNNGKGDTAYYNSNGSSTETQKLYVFRTFQSDFRGINVGDSSRDYY